jgi:hypothetical protein
MRGVGVPFPNFALLLSHLIASVAVFGQPGKPLGSILDQILPMKKSIIPCAIACFVSITSLFGADSSWLPGKVSSAPVDASKTPEGLAPSDWSSIRAAYEHGRHAIVANPDGTHQARNPGQAWLTKFDGSGFTVTPDTGGWS